MMRLGPLLISCVLIASGCASTQPRSRQPQTTFQSPLDSQAIARILQLSGNTTDGVFKVTKPRTDITVVMDGFPITPRMGLTAWLAFQPHGNRVMVMGDLPLLEDELQPVLSALMEHGIEVSALHNHFIGEDARVMFLHVGGTGDPVMLATGLRAALDAIEQVRQTHPLAPSSTTVSSDLDPKRLGSILGVDGELKDGVFKVTISRPTVRLTEMGIPVNSVMGFNSWAAFQGTNERAAVSGDFAMLVDEVSPIVQELRRAGIKVVAIHNHMLRETPRIFFLHFWGVGRAEDLTRGVRAALDQMSGPIH